MADRLLEAGLEYLQQTETGISIFLTPGGLNQATGGIRVISPALLQVCGAP